MDEPDGFRNRLAVPDGPEIDVHGIADLSVHPNGGYG